MATQTAHKTVRISEDARRLLQWLSEKEGRSMQAVLRSALEVYRRQRFLEEMNASYAELRSDARSWDEWSSEVSLWDRTLSDGLVAEPRPRYGAARAKRANRPKRNKRS
jgi:hypothetical protein